MPSPAFLHNKLQQMKTTSGFSVGLGLRLLLSDPWLPPVVAEPEASGTFSGPARLYPARACCRPSLLTEAHAASSAPAHPLLPSQTAATPSASPVPGMPAAPLLPSNPKSVAPTPPVGRTHVILLAAAAPVPRTRLRPAHSCARDLCTTLFIEPAIYEINYC
ncbi:hypothetical protein EVAR_21686_1 [Eumeta japonica]|uniref:Uncharacterized protein n=1 Tax=Eumeta variegata TaxID=151549 RepID=A0A4C1W634_EUMVA|nr:hypothetical protein EVAR_21686_1 [Eumeta japonica]